jgi:hypothetical protein
MRQCVDAVTTLRQKMEKDVSRFGSSGNGKWRDRMKGATRKKNLADHLVKVERAKTQLMVVMQKLSMYVMSSPALCISSLTNLAI